MIGRQDIYASMGARPLLGLLNASGGLLAYNSPYTWQFLEDGAGMADQDRFWGKTSPKILDSPANRGTMDPESEVMSMNRVKEYRLAIGWSQEQLAARAGCSASYVSRIESGQRSGSIDVRVRIAAAL